MRGTLRVPPLEICKRKGLTKTAHGVRTMNRYPSAFWQILKKATQTSLQLYKIMIPVIIVVKIVKELGLIEFLGRLLAPAMHITGLPGSAGLVWATTMITNIYGGMIVFASLYGIHPLTVAQTTVLTSMMLLAHSLPIELRIAQKAGVRLYVMAVLRIGGAFIFGWCLKEAYLLGPWLQAPNLVSWIPKAEDPSLLSWLIAQLKSLALIYLAIFALLCLMKLLDRLGISRIMTRCLDPVLKLLGIGKEASTITIIGMTLGLAYGGGLIIEEAKSGRIERKDILFSLTLMGLCHSIIEDTLATLVLGGHISGILFGRMTFAILCTYWLVKWISRLSESTFEKYFSWNNAPFSCRNSA